MILRYRNCISLYINLQRRCVCSTTRVVFKNDLCAPAYKPEIVELFKYEKWEESGAFEANNNTGKPVFSMVLPPPNVTGKLHLGHALACTIQDVIARRKRSLGYNVLWLPGTDHAGIATQNVVEKYLKSTRNLDRHRMTREEFNKEVWDWTRKHGNTINRQMKKLGCSLDWSRSVFTMDQKHCKAVNAAFINLFERGLIYRQKAPVNWCRALKSTISDMEVENKYINGPTKLEVYGYTKPVTFGILYRFAYKIFGSTEEIVVTTTMPETMLGDTAVAVHPNDIRYTHLVGKKVLHPFTGKTMPIIQDPFVDPLFGTGAVKITPAHSKVDFDIAFKHRLPIVQVIGEDGNIQNSGKFNRLPRYECRDLIVRELTKLGLMRHQSPHQLNLPVCSRSGDIVDNLLKDQWFVSCNTLNEEAIELVRKGELSIEPDRYMKRWFDWAMDNRDWCISRQLWWGHQIPAFKCTVDEKFTWVAAEDEEIARIKASKPLQALADEITAVRDTDVLDTWFSSAIYPFAALGWPEHHRNDDFSTYYPLNLMATGHDILGFWVHRMMLLGLELTDMLPFNKVLLHGVICDNKGSKMSKSRGNVIDPIDVINGITMEKLQAKTQDMYKTGILSKEELEKANNYHKANFSNTNGITECGVDALRFTLLSQDIKSNFVNFDVHYCHANKLFCNKIWQSVKYTQLSFGKLRNIENEITTNDLTFFDKWILSRLANMVAKVNESMEKYDFHLVTKALRSLIYSDFCDVYIEATKPGFLTDNVKVGYAHAHTLSAVLNTSLRALSPIMVYLADELIPTIPDFKSNIIHNFKDVDATCYEYPLFENFSAWDNKPLEKQVEKVLNIVDLVRELKGLYGMSNKNRPHIRVLSKDDILKTDLERHKSVVLDLTRCQGIDFDNKSDRNYAAGFLDDETEVSVEILGDNAINTIISARERLQKKMSKIEDTLKKLEQRISNEHYIAAVPEWNQNMDKEKIVTKKKQLQQMQRLIK